jgi:hypothetical protein
LAVCFSDWADLDGALIDAGCFGFVRSLLTCGAAKVALQAMLLIRVVLTKGAGADARDFAAQWAAVGRRDEAKVICRWALFTQEMLKHNREMLADPFVDAGVVRCLFAWATNGCFRVRRAALSGFLDSARRLSGEAVWELVRGGAVADVAELSRELDGEQALEIVEFLVFLLTSALDAQCVREIYRQLSASALIEAVERMVESIDLTVREAAMTFHEALLDVVQGIED